VARGELRADLGAAPDLDDLVRCLVEPYAALLAEPGGRAYLRIVAQLRGRFAAWRVASDAATTAHLAAVLDEIEQRASPEAAVRRERVVGLIMLLTGLTAERARRIDDGAQPELDHRAFVDALVAMCTAVVAG
jgi:hypothetical protein